MRRIEPKKIIFHLKCFQNMENLVLGWYMCKDDKLLKHFILRYQIVTLLTRQSGNSFSLQGRQVLY